MTLWRLEVARLIRTNRWMILFGVYGLFGVLGPVTARYLGEIVSRFGGDVEIAFPDPEPVDGLAQFVSNASQIGVLAVVVVAAGALAFDSRPEIAAFYRTRVPGSWSLIRPRVVVVLMAASGAVTVGTVLAVAGTEALIGGLDVPAVVVGTLLSLGYVAFIVALVAAAATVARAAVTTVFLVLAIALMLPLVGLVGALKPWLPSELVAAPLVTATGGTATDFVRSLGVTASITAGLLALAVRRAAAREL